MIKLGSRVKDMITGFNGVAVARTEWLYGCSRIGIEQDRLHDGKPIDTQWFDEQRVELVLEKPAPVSEHSEATTGGPQSDPSRSAQRP